MKKLKEVQKIAEVKEKKEAEQKEATEVIENCGHKVKRVIFVRSVDLQNTGLTSLMSLQAQEVESLTHDQTFVIIKTKFETVLVPLSNVSFLCKE